MASSNWIFIVWFSISAFPLIQCLNEKTIGELKSTLEPLKLGLDSALANYRKNDYRVFNKTVAVYKPISEIVGDLSDNATYKSDKNSKLAFYKLTLYQFIYPVLADPLKLSDALKVSALIVLLKQENTNTSSPNVVELKKNIRKIIEREKNHDFIKADLYLTSLYFDLYNLDKELHPLTSGFVDYDMNTFEKFCIGKNRQEIISKCGLNLIRNITKQKMNLAKLHKLLPVDAPEKVEKLTKVIQEYLEVEKVQKSLSSLKNIQCYGFRCEQKMETDLELVRNVQRTLPELLLVVTPYKDHLEETVSGYIHYQYHAFAKVAFQYLFSREFKRRIDRLPENSTINDSAEAKQTFTELTIYKYLFPVLSDPKQLSEALKVNALINGIIKKENDSSTELNEVIETIKQIIVEENKINQDFTKANLVLDDLYHDLGMPKPETLVLTNGFINQMMNTIGAFCQKSSDNYSKTLEGAILDVHLLNEWLNNHFHYIKTEKRLLESVKDLKNFWKSWKRLEKLINEENIDCNVLECFKKTKTSTDFR